MEKPLALFVGRTTVDAVYWLDALPEENTKTYARHFHAAPGGPALNAAVTHALLGGQTLLASAVGGGPWAAMVRAELEQLGIGLLDMAAGTGYETPLCAVLVNGANASRTIVNPPMDRTALGRLGAWPEEAAALGGTMPPMVLTDGFLLDQAMDLLRSLGDAGAVLCLDGGSWKPGTGELAGLLTVAICSERFTVPGKSEGAGSDPRTIAEWFAAKGVEHVAVTRGGEAILGWDRGRRFEIEVAQVEAVDTLGAGDVLHGAFCHFFARQREFEPALRQAAEIASLSCQSLGTRAWAARRAVE